MSENVSGNIYFPSLDGVRFLAVSFVLFCHWLFYGQLQGLNIFLGAAGVNIFFTLSAFLIARILLIQKVYYKQRGIKLFKSFYLRRVLRIFPLYFIVLIIGLILVIPGARETWFQLTTFTLNIPKGTLATWPAGFYSHLWSLSAEEQFYFVFPILVALVPNRFLLHLFWGMIFIGIASRIAIYLTDISVNDKKGLSYHFTPCCFDSFGFGALLAWYYCFQPDRLKRFIGNIYFIIACSVFFLVFAILHMTLYNAPLTNILVRSSTSVYCFLLFGSLILKTVPDWLYDFFTNKLVVYLGKISFGIYVFHLFSPWVLQQFGLYYPDYRFSIPINAVIFGTVTILLSVISWEFFEKPINKLKSRFPYKSS